MNYYKIFLASSNELASERKAFVAAIHDFNRMLMRRDVTLEVEWWEDMDDAFNTSCKQDDYNKYLTECDLFLLLIWSKVGKYSNLEFDLAFRLFTDKHLPRVYVYEKTVPKPEATDRDKESKREFLAKISPAGKEQFQSTFDHFDTVILKFKDNLLRLLDDKGESHFKPGRYAEQGGTIAELLSPNGVDAPPVFFGREDELKKISEKLQAGGQLMLINAEGGIGKTTIAAKYWHNTLGHYKYNAWLFCEGGITVALKQLAPKLAVDLSSYDTEDAQVGALKRALSDRQNDFLLVLDNANDPDEILAFQQQFAGWHWHVLITSRCAGVLDESRELPIMHLPPPLAKALFTKYYTEPSNPDFDALLDRLLEAIQYHTLLVDTFAKNMAEARELGMDMSTFLQQLETGGLHLGKHSFEIVSEYGKTHKAATTDQILDALYDFSKFTEPERHAMVNLALLPAVPYTLPFLITLFADEDTKHRYRDTVKKLVKTGWISDVGHNYRLSPVIQKLVLEKNEATLGSDSKQLMDRLRELLDNDGYNLNIGIKNAAPYISLAEHLCKCLVAFPSLLVGTYMFSTIIYYQNIGDWTGVKIFIDHYKNNFQELLLASPDNLIYKQRLAISYSKLGDVHKAKGDLDNALKDYQECFIRMKHIYDHSPHLSGYKNILAISHSKLGDAYKAKGDLDNALKNYQEDFLLTRDIYESSPDNVYYKNGLAISVAKLGSVYEAKGDWDNALKKYLEYYKLRKEVSDGSADNLAYKNGLAISYEKLGNVYSAKNDWESALHNYQEELKLFNEICDQSPDTMAYKNGLATSYSKLGFSFERRNKKRDVSQAKKYYRKAQKIWQAIQDEWPGIAEIENNLRWVNIQLKSIGENGS